MKSGLICAVLLAGFCVPCGAQTSRVEQAFLQPAPAAKPWVWWHWMNGNISRAGIHAELEAMARVGIGGCSVTSADPPPGVPRGPVDFMSHEWLDLVHYAMEECDRLGLGFGMAAGDGWTQLGGPWISPEESMQVITWSEKTVEGPADLSVTLPPPSARQEYFRDIAVLAFPSEGPSLKDVAFSVTCSVPDIDFRPMTDGNLDTELVLPRATKEKPVVLDFHFETPFRAASMAMLFGEYLQIHEGRIEVSDDGIDYRVIRRFKSPNGGSEFSSIGVSLPPVETEYFRVVFEESSRGARGILIQELEVYGNQKIDRWTEKAGFVRAERMPLQLNAPVRSVAENSVIDLTECMDAQGVLRWKAPPGQWTIVRLAYTTTGYENKPATEKGRGLEADKFSRKVVRKHFSQYTGKILETAGPQARKAFRRIHTDSWEQGTQNWSHDFLNEFSRRRGFDAKPYLLALVGYPVGGAQTAERFLWDFRQTCSDLIADNYYGELRRIAAESGLQYSAETFGFGNFNNQDASSQVDVPMGEFWMNETFWLPRIKGPASAAHLQGKSCVGLEAFTTRNNVDGFSLHPYRTKVFGDAAFCYGGNQLNIHSWAHDPTADRFPGMTFSVFGLIYNNRQTWFEQSSAWIDYLARCQSLLQQGRFVADLLYFIGENNPYAIYHNPLAETPPAGYDYDLCHAEALLKDASVDRGDIVFSSGARYRVLVLQPESVYMTLPVLRKIGSLVEQGATVLGPKPVTSPSLADQDHLDEFQALADRLWCSGLGAPKGVVLQDLAVGTVLKQTGVKPDVEFPGVDGEAPLWIHRKVGEEHIYFISNQQDQELAVDAVFRVSGLIPELWRADTGVITLPGGRESTPDGRSKIHLSLDPYGSAFVVFRPDPETAEVRPQEPVSFSTVCSVDGPWELSFPPQFGYADQLPESRTLEQLASWADSEDENLKYFSGTGVYKTAFSLPDKKQDCRYVLELGQVDVMAEVLLNGRPQGIVWKPPYQVYVTSDLCEGSNQLEIRAVNQWVNRLIGDERIPAALPIQQNGILRQEDTPDWFVNGGAVPDTGRVGFSFYRRWAADSPLLPSGLIGPVCLKEVR
jgi:hypothetical protein